MYLNPNNLNSNKKKKRGQRATGGDKSGRGLRQFSMKGFVSHIFLFVSFGTYVFIFNILATVFTTL